MTLFDWLSGAKTPRSSLQSCSSPLHEWFSTSTSLSSQPIMARHVQQRAGWCGYPQVKWIQAKPITGLPETIMTTREVSFSSYAQRKAHGQVLYRVTVTVRFWCHCGFVTTVMSYRLCPAFLLTEQWALYPMNLGQQLSYPAITVGTISSREACTTSIIGPIRTTPYRFRQIPYCLTSLLGIYTYAPLQRHNVCWMVGKDR